MEDRRTFIEKAFELVEELRRTRGDTLDSACDWLEKARLASVEGDVPAAVRAAYVARQKLDDAIAELVDRLEDR